MVSNKMKEKSHGPIGLAMHKWYNNIDKQEAFNRTQNFALEHGMSDSNSSTLTLLFKPGDFSTLEEVRKKTEQFMVNIDSPAIISIEPVLMKRNQSLPDLYRSAGYGKLELLPLYHIHILLIEKDYEVRQLRKVWSRIVGCKRRTLFQCKYIETSVRQTNNYITKFFEEQRGQAGTIGFYIPASKVRNDNLQTKLNLEQAETILKLPDETISCEVISDKIIFSTNFKLLHKIISGNNIESFGRHNTIVNFIFSAGFCSVERSIRPP